MKYINQINKNINALIRKGAIQQAIEYCQSLLLNDASNSHLHIRLGDLYLDGHLDIYQAKQYIDEAIIEYQKAAELLIDNGDIYYKIGVALYYKTEFDKAINYFNIALDKNANKSKCYYMIARCFEKKCRFQDSLQYLNLALKNSFIGSSHVRYAKFKILKSLHIKSTKKKFLAYWEFFLSLLLLPFDNESIKSLKNKSRLIPYFFINSRVWFLVKMNKIDEVCDYVNSLIDKMPGSVFLYLLLGEIYATIGKLDEAVIEYKMALWLDSLSRDAYKGIVRSYEEMGDYDNAISYYNKAIQVFPNEPIFYSNLGELYFLKNDFKEAISQYQSAALINPSPIWTSKVAQIIGYVHQNVTKNIDSSISYYMLANMLNPKDIDPYISLGSAFYDNQDYSNALIVYRRALELDPNNSKIHCNLGFLHWGMDDLDEAIKEYKLSIKYDPMYDIAYNNLGVIYLDDLVQLQNAIDCFNKATECNPNYALAYYNLGRCYALKNENIEAAKYFQTAMNVNNITNEIDPSDIAERLNNLFN